jgi:hypothetical protein
VQSAPRATLTVSSSPPLASVTLDGVARGETPLALGGLLPGRHVLRVDAADHETYSRLVDVPAEGAAMTLELAPLTAQEALRALDAELHGAGDRAALITRAAALARAANAGAVIVGALVPFGDTFVVTAARVLPDGTASVAWTAVDATLLKALPAAGALAGALLEQTGPIFADAGVVAPAAKLDFERLLLGVSLAPVAPPAVAKPEEPVPVYRRWWFWTGAGALLAGAGAASGYGVWRATVAPVHAPDMVDVTVTVHR